jgi:hypothetical protein
MKLIGVHGKARSGKDTFARALNKTEAFHRMAFADPLKSAVAGLFNIPLEVAFSEDKDQEVKPWGLTLRDILQRFGTEAMRDVFGQDFWINRWLAEYLELQDHNVVVTDVRFANEAALIRSMGGTVVHMQRDGAGLAGPLSGHLSEQTLPYEPGDVIVLNNGTVDNLTSKARNILQSFYAPEQ